MTNLLAETEQELQGLHKSPADVAWVGSRDGSVAGTWERFAALAHDIDYDAGYGTQWIAHDLVIVFADGSWLERHEYDGSECWAYKARPLLRLAFKPLELCRVLSDTWSLGASDDDDEASDREIQGDRYLGGTLTFHRYADLTVDA